MMQWIRDAWLSMPPEQRWIMLVAIAAVVIVAIVFGVWPQLVGLLGV